MGKIIVLVFFCLFCLAGCATFFLYTADGQSVNFRESLTIEVQSGSVRITMHGHMSEDLYKIEKDEDRGRERKVLAVRHLPIILTDG